MKTEYPASLKPLKPIVEDLVTDVSGLSSDFSSLQSKVNSISKTSGMSTVTYNGLTFNYWKYGNVVTVSCASGRTSAARGANVPIGTLPASIRPLAQLNAVNTATEAKERWLIQTDGNVQCVSETPANTYVRLFFTYVCKNT